MKTGSHLKIKQFGTVTMGVDLSGDPSRPEPKYFVVYFPGGMVEIARCTNNEYWIHSYALQPTLSDGGRADGRSPGKIIDARCHSDAQTPIPQVYNLAVRITTDLSQPDESSLYL